MNRALKIFGIVLISGLLIAGGTLLYFYLQRDSMIMDGPGMVNESKQVELLGTWDNPAELSNDQLVFTYDTVTEKREGIKVQETAYRFEDDVNGTYRISPPPFKEFLFADYFVLYQTEEGFGLKGYRKDEAGTKTQVYQKRPEDK